MCPNQETVMYIVQISRIQFMNLFDDPNPLLMSTTCSAGRGNNDEDENDGLGQTLTKLLPCTKKAQKPKGNWNKKGTGL